MNRFKREDSADSLLQHGPRSEYVKKYPEHRIQKTKSYKPPQELTTGQGEIDSLTIQRKDYPEHLNAERRKAFKPDNSRVDPGIFDSHTSNRDHYPEWQLPERRPRAKEEWHPPEQPIDGNTTTHLDYPPREVQKTKPYKPDNTRGDLGPFEGQPSYREDYPEWQLPPRHKRERANYIPPQQPFLDRTTNHSDFPAHQVSPRVVARADMKPVHSDAPFIGTTDYNETFKQHPLPPKQRRERPEWRKPAEPFDGTTTQSKDFIGATAPRQRSMKPNQTAVSSGAPLEGDTTTSLAYRPVELPKRYKHEPEKYKQPEGPMDLNTTTGVNYREHPLQKANVVRPGSSGLLRGQGEMEKNSNYFKDYPEHHPGKINRVRAPNDYQPPTEPLDSLTINQTDYHPHKIMPKQNYRPRDAPIRSDQPFDDRTGYRETFKEHKVSQRQMPEREVYKGPTAPLDTKTTTQESYLGAYQPKRESFRPTGNTVRSDVPFEGDTTMNRDYRAHEVKRRELIKPAEYQKPTGNMDLNTTHGVYYKEMPIQRQTFERPSSSHLLKGEGQMSDTTNYQGDYIPRAIEKRKPLKPDDSYRPPVDPMDSVTTHQADYFARQVQKRENFRPRDEPIGSNVPFADRTENRDTFIPHKVSPREIRKKEKHEGPTAPLDDRTTVRDSYKGQYQPPRESLKPNTNFVKSDVPFQSETTMRQTYKEVQLPEKYVHRQEAYQKPDGYMDLNTTHGTNYKEHPLERLTINRPGSSHLLQGHGEMATTTNYQSHYQEPPAVQRELVRKRGEYVPPTVPLDSTTTTSTSYKNHGVTPRTTYKPKDDYQKSNAPFEDRTNYRELFTEHKVQPREVMKKEEYKPPSAPLETTTTTHDSYVGKYQPKRESFRPDRNLVKSDIPFESVTTVGSTYKPWPAHERFRHRPAEYVKPEGNMDLTTINRETYKEVRGERASMRKLGDSGLLTGMGQFDNHTSYGDAFVPKSVDRKLVKADNQYIPSTVPFDNTTTYQVSHVGYTAPKERSKRPDAMSDVLGQRDKANPFHIQGDWRDMLNMPKTETVSA